MENKLIESVKKTYEENLDIMRAKNFDYAGDQDPFANFKNSLVVGVPVSRGILVRLMDKVARINRLLDNDAKVLDESLLDTLSDAINYLAILKAWIEDDKVC